MPQTSQWMFLVAVIVGFLQSGESLENGKDVEITGVGSMGLEYVTPHHEEDSIEIPRLEFTENDDDVSNVSTEIIVAHEEITTKSTLVSFSSQSDVEKSVNNVTEEFKPSVHLGKIEESRGGANPFNQPRHLEFSGTLGSSGSQQNDGTLNFQEDYTPFHVPENFPQTTPRPGRITFEDNSHGVVANFQVPWEHVGGRPSSDFHGSTNFLETSTGSKGFYQVQPETVRPSNFQESTNFHASQEHVLNRPLSDFHGPTKFLETSTGPVAFYQIHSDAVRPSNLQESTNFQAPQEHIVNRPLTDFHGSTKFLETSTGPVGFYQVQPEAVRPSNLQESTFHAGNAPVVYLAEQQSSFTRTRAFPYQYYQPPFGYAETEVLGNQPHQLGHPVARRVSPWKKIVHLIGAFLPLGLLLAALTPNVVRVDNSTQPNIVLSKLRGVDLPVEHKRARHVDHWRVSCEDRVICQMIMAGGQSRTNILQNILWDLVGRTSDETAKKNGLLEIFQAVKKKDCSLVDCPN